MAEPSTPTPSSNRGMMRGRSTSRRDIDVSADLGLGLGDFPSEGELAVPPSPPSSSSMSTSSYSSNTSSDSEVSDEDKRRGLAPEKKRSVRVSKQTLAILRDLKPLTAHCALVDSDGLGGPPPEDDDNKVASDLAMLSNVRSRLAVTSSVTPEPVSPTAATHTAASAAGGSGAAPSAHVPSTTAAAPPTARLSLGLKPKTNRPTERAYDYAVKLLMLGDSGVGKSSLMMQYTDRYFSPSLMSTAGVDYKTKYMSVSGKVVKCIIWDTAGQERFQVITQSYYRGVQGIVLVYDVSDPSESTFTNVRSWTERIRAHASSDVPKILIGNKIDMPTKQIDSSRGAAVAKEFDMKFFETSAKNNTNVSKAFNALIKDIVKRQMALPAPADAGKGAGGSGTAPASEADGDGKKCTIM